MLCLDERYNVSDLEPAVSPRTPAITSYRLIIHLQWYTVIWQQIKLEINRLYACILIRSELYLLHIEINQTCVILISAHWKASFSWPNSKTDFEWSFTARAKTGCIATSWELLSAALQENGGGSKNRYYDGPNFKHFHNTPPIGEYSFLYSLEGFLENKLGYILHLRIKWRKLKMGVGLLGRKTYFLLPLAP